MLIMFSPRTVCDCRHDSSKGSLLGGCEHGLAHLASLLSLVELKRQFLLQKGRQIGPLDLPLQHFGLCPVRGRGNREAEVGETHVVSVQTLLQVQQQQSLDLVSGHRDVLLAEAIFEIVRPCGPKVVVQLSGRFWVAENEQDDEQGPALVGRLGGGGFGQHQHPFRVICQESQLATHFLECGQNSPGESPHGLK